jgi:hypothetical protein
VYFEQAARYVVPQVSAARGYMLRAELVARARGKRPGLLTLGRVLPLSSTVHAPSNHPTVY